MNDRLLTLVFTMLLCLSSFGQKGDKTMSITFVGDIILDRGVETEMRLHSDTILVNSLQRINANDIYIINNEGTFTDSDSARNKRYVFKADKQKASLLKQAGVSHASVANNHSFDYGDTGYTQTINTLQENNITPLGQDLNPEWIKKNGQKCAIISASLIELSQDSLASIIKTIDQNITSFKEEHQDTPLILYLHWGYEMQRSPSSWQQELAHKWVHLGVNAIIGHHPHVVQTVEYIGNVPVFYSIGNCVADAYLTDTYSALVVTIDINSEINNVSLSAIDLSSYFPKKYDSNQQESELQKLLSYSKDVCIYKTPENWSLVPSEKVDFTEPSNKWLFISDESAVSIRKLDSSRHIMHYYHENHRSNMICLHGKLSELQITDINNDRNKDVLVGIAKEVNFDRQVKKRINIFSYQDSILNPLWLGTKFIFDVKSFDILEMEGIKHLSTEEIDSSGVHYQGIYEWDDFGFALVKMTNIEQHKH